MVSGYGGGRAAAGGLGENIKGVWRERKRRVRLARVAHSSRSQPARAERAGARALDLSQQQSKEEQEQQVAVASWVGQRQLQPQREEEKGSEQRRVGWCGVSGGLLACAKYAGETGCRKSGRACRLLRKPTYAPAGRVDSLGQIWRCGGPKHANAAFGSCPDKKEWPEIIIAGFILLTQRRGCLLDLLGWQGWALLSERFFLGGWHFGGGVISSLAVPGWGLAGLLRAGEPREWMLAGL